MVVHVTLHTVLQQQPGGKRRAHLEVALDDGTTVSALYQRLELRFPLEELLLVVNRRIVPAEQVLEDGDQVDFIPALSGGKVDKPPQIRYTCNPEG